MQIVILTSSRRGTASYCLPLIVQRSSAKVAMVVLNVENRKKDFAFYKKKFKKMISIGVLGTINGIRMRKWYTDDVNRITRSEDIEELCKKLNIPFRVVNGINNESTMALFNEADADLGLSLGNSYISKRIFSIPRLGMLNIHGELLPQFKNAQSVIWQLYENHSVTGYSIHEINSKIDDGAILKREKLPIIFKETLEETVSYNCAEILRQAAEGLLQILNEYPRFQNNKQPQKGGMTYTTPSYRQFVQIKRNFRKFKGADKAAKTP